MTARYPLAAGTPRRIEAIGPLFVAGKANARELHLHRAGRHDTIDWHDCREVTCSMLRATIAQYERRAWIEGEEVRRTLRDVEARRALRSSF